MRLIYTLRLICLVSILFIFNGLQAQDTTKLDKLPGDSISPAELQEDSFQSFLDTLYDSVDTAGWDTRMINTDSY